MTLGANGSLFNSNPKHVITKNAENTVFFSQNWPFGNGTVHMVLKCKKGLCNVEVCEGSMLLERAKDLCC